MRWTLPMLLTTLVLGPAAPSWAQPAPDAAQPGESQPSETQPKTPQPPAIEPPRAPETSLDPARTIARELTRIGHMDLRLQDSPTPEDLAMLDALLAIAQNLDPANQERLRRRVDLAYRLGDPERVEARTRELVRLDPKDTVALLRLISSRIAQIQTVEGRMEAYSRYLGPAGQKLGASIRSRLALDAALLAREQGDERGFVGLLTKAVQLDATNKDAAALAATFFSTRIPDDDAGQLELSLNLLLADPVDPHVHMLIARQLARVGLFAHARRFHVLASRIHVAEAGGVTDQLNTERLILAWHLRGPEAPLKEITDSLASQRYNAAVQLQAYQDQGLPTHGLIEPKDIRLGESLERIRVLAAHAAGDQELLAQSLNELRGSLEQLNRMRLSPGELPPGVTIEQVTSQATALTISLFLLHAWTGFNMETIIQRLRDDPAIFGEDAPPILRAFAAIYVDSPEDAEARFRALLQSDATAWIGLGLALEIQGRLNEAVGAYARIALEYPLEPAGAWAHSRVSRLAGRDVLLSPQAEAMSRLASGVPAWIDRMIASPSSAMQLEAEFVRSSFTPLQPMQLRVTLRNASPAPLGLGGDRPIQSRLLVSPTIDVGIQRRIVTSLPEVLDLERRLRLNPREEVVATVDVLPAFTGWFMDSSIEATGRVRARVIQGFRQDAQGRLQKGPLALANETATVLRTTVAEAQMSPQELAIRIEQASESQLATSFLAARMLLIGIRGELEPAAAQRIVGACVDRFPTLSPQTRALAILLLPTARLVPALRPFEDAVMIFASRESDRLVLAATLLTRVTEAGDPILDLEAVASDPELRAIAGGVRARAEREGVSYANTGPGVGKLIPRSLSRPGN